MQDWLIVLGSYFVRPRVARLKHVPLLSNPTPKKMKKGIKHLHSRLLLKRKRGFFLEKIEKIRYSAIENTKNNSKILQYQCLIS